MSLTHALRWVALGGGLEMDFDDLHAALGLSMMSCAAQSERDLSRWPMFARDSFLIETARLFGVQIRDMHPPETAHGLSRTDAFAQHFDASYRPLIARALENNQPVFAWQGWSSETDLRWGVITRTCSEGAGFAGRTGSALLRVGGADEQVLVRPPVQVYVVETTATVRPTAEQLFALAIDHSRRALLNEPGARFDVVAGPRAYDVWIDSLNGEFAREVDLKTLACGHTRLASSVVAGHRSAIRFLNRHLLNGVRGGGSSIDSLPGSCHRLVTLLEASIDSASVEAMMQTASGRARLIDQLWLAQNAVEDILTDLEKPDG